MRCSLERAFGSPQSVRSVLLTAASDEERAMSTPIPEDVARAQATWQGRDAGSAEACKRYAGQPTGTPPPGRGSPGDGSRSSRR